MVASLAVLTLDFRDTGPVQTLRRAASVVLSPLQSAGETATQPLRNLWQGATDNERLRNENERLRREVDKARGARLDAQALRRDNDALRRIANIKVGTIATKGARVLTGPLSNFSNEIRIDVGSGEGIKVGMVVVTDAGIVGTVRRVNGGTSDVELVTDPNFKMGVRFTNANADAVVAHGDGQGRPLVVDGGIRADKPVLKGDSVTTSGDSRSPFPPGVKVGTVRSSQQSKDFAEKSVQIDPAADLGDLRYVAVLLYDAPR